MNAKAVLVGLSWDIYYAHKISYMLDDNQVFYSIFLQFFLLLWSYRDRTRPVRVCSYRRFMRQPLPYTTIFFFLFGGREEGARGEYTHFFLNALTAISDLDYEHTSRH